MLVARRQRVSSYEARLTLCLDERSLEFTENSGLVDGIGGVAWDGSFLMARTLRRLVESCPAASSLHVLELGCGLGICGISIASRVAAVTLTDQTIDLAASNALATPGASNVVTLPQSWGEGLEEDLLRRRAAGTPDILVGCEVACLRSQQRKLVDTIRGLAGRRTVVLLSFDEHPPPNRCSAERDMHALMLDAGFRGVCVSAARVRWSIPKAGASIATMEGIKVESEICIGPDNLPCAQLEAFSGDPIEMHHIVAYFMEETTATCPSCGKSKFSFPR